MKRFIVISILYFGIINSVKSQVGINTTSPNAQLDIRPTNQVAPTATDGILIPKVDTFPTGVSADQDAILIYLTTTIGNNTPGFYYYNHATASWLSIGKGAKSINELTDGKSDADGSNNGSSIFLGVNAGANDDEDNNRNIGIGLGALAGNVSGFNNIAIGSSALANNTASRNVAIGSSALGLNTSGSNNTAVGNGSLVGNQTGSENVSIGSLALLNNTTGNRNTAVGFSSLSANTTGSNNSSFGRQALENNTTGFDNLGIGTFALRNNTEGIWNVAVGNSALSNNTTAGQNVAIGVDAMRSNINGNWNVAVGHAALRNSSASIQNTAIGYLSLFSNTTGSNNVAVGFNSLVSNTTGDDNTVLGHLALSANTEGNNNTAIGASALYNNTTGANNIGLGFQALQNNTIGILNIGIGTNTLLNNTTGSSQIALGLFALESQINGTGNIAIGNNALDSNIDGSSNIGIGQQSGGNNANGSFNIFIGNGSGNNELGSNKLYIENSDADANNALIYGEFDNDLLRLNGRTEITATTDANGTAGSGALEVAGSLRLDGNEIITNTGSTLFLQSDNNGDVEMDGGTFRMDASTNRVGIGIVNPQSTLHVNGEFRIGDETISDAGNDALLINAALIPEFDDTNVIGNPAQRWRTIYAVNGTINTSDRREKTNINTISYGLAEVLNMNPVSFNWKNSSNPDVKLGLIAQELQELVPEVVISHLWEKDEQTGEMKKIPTKRLGVYYSDLMPVLVKAIQEQQAIIVDQNKRLELLEYQNNELQELKSEIEDIKKQIQRN
jgi:hypothetical protein